MRALEAILLDRDDSPLDLAALEIAKIEYPDLDPDPFIQLLDSYAIELSERLDDEMPGPEFIAVTNHYLFEELGFRGNHEDYYNPKNSCLNDVLTSRTGIPITLSLVYIEIARRLAKTVHGVGLPGHFLLMFEDEDADSFLIDPFHGGGILNRDDAINLAESAVGRELPPDPSMFEPVTPRQMLVRMLNNLRAIYLRTDQHAKSVQVLDWLILSAPGGAEEYKQRGLVRIQLQQFDKAVKDLEMYLRLAPEAADAAAIAKHLSLLKRYIAQKG